MNTVIAKNKINDRFIPFGTVDNNLQMTVRFMYDNGSNSIDLTNLTTHISKYNMTVTKTTSNYTEATGTTSQIASLLNTKFKKYFGNYYSHDTDLTIPSQLSNVTGVMGTTTLPIATPKYKIQSKEYIPVNPKVTTSPSTANLTYFTPLQLASLYKFPTSTATNQCIAIIELGGGYTTAEMTTYWSYLGLTTTPTVIPINIAGGTNNPADTSGANYEVVLDIQVSGALANAATILVYFAPNTDTGFYDAIQAAIQAGYYGYTYNSVKYYPSSVSISWGAPEAEWGSSTLSSFNTLLSTATTTPTTTPTGPNRYVNVFVAAGDSGSSDGLRGNNVDFPASSPNVVACGGTSLAATASVISSETVWNHGGSTGGGFSSYFARPSYQNGIVGISQQSKRALPDIAANADPYTGYVIYIAGQYVVVGGTSAVAPLMAGLVARLNQIHISRSNTTTFGLLNPILYNSSEYTLTNGKDISKLCYDIVSGTNGAYSATTGWDPCTGWGRIQGNLIVNLM